jgi:hypothetical protein
MMVSVATGLFVGMVVLYELGRYLHTRRAMSDDGVGTTVIESSVFALLGLLVAFTFSGAVTRFDSRRAFVGREANAISTAYRRLDLLPAEAQGELRELFRTYLEVRLQIIYTVPGQDEARKALAETQDLQNKIWDRAVAACRSLPDTATRTLQLSAINEMIDIANTREVAAEIHPPVIIFILLITVGLTCSLLAGYTTGQRGRRRWIPMVAFAAVTSATVYVIVDIEYPRRGLIRIDAADQVLMDVRQQMK